MNRSDLPRFIIGGVFLVFGPLALIAYVLWYASATDPRTSTAEAAVVRIEVYRGSNHSMSECPVFAFDAGSVAVEAESNVCDLDLTPGTRLDVRYDPQHPDDVAPSAGYDPHPEMIPVIAATVVSTLIAAFMLWPKKKRTA